MLAQPIHNKTTLRRGSAPSMQIIAPVRGVACEVMNWREHFTYNPVTGDLIWLPKLTHEFKNPRAENAWNARYALRIAGTIRYNGGRSVSMGVQLWGKRYGVNRVVWEMYNGAIPRGYFIDHINRNPGDNRVENLRLCTNRENQWNRRKMSTNSAGVIGIHKSNQAWKSYISTRQGRVFLGTFHTKGLAAVAYAKATLRYHGKFAAILSK